jgi:hypothetical protein
VVICCIFILVLFLFLLICSCIEPFRKQNAIVKNKREDLIDTGLFKSSSLMLRLLRTSSSFNPRTVVTFRSKSKENCCLQQISQTNFFSRHLHKIAKIRGIYLRINFFYKMTKAFGCFVSLIPHFPTTKCAYISQL